MDGASPAADACAAFPAGGRQPAGPDRRDLQKLRHLAGRAIVEHDLIADGDTVMVAVSGGKDSLVLARFLADLRERAPIRYRLGAIHLGPGENGPLGEWLKGLALDFMHWEPAPVVPELAAYRPGSPSPCFACARARRRRFFEACRRYGASRLALGHHLDDAQETLLMNIFFSGRLEGLYPNQKLFEGRLSIIRPLFLVPEYLVRRLAGAWNLPVMASGCPADGRTARGEIKDIVAGLIRRHPKVPGNLMAVTETAARGSGATPKAANDEK